MADWYLQWLVAQVNQPPHDLEFPITLLVSGAVITGQLVSGKTFYAGLREQLDSFFKGNAAESTLDVFTKTPAEIYEQPLGEGDPLPGFIHLRNAQVFAPGQKPMPENGTWWRGRISQVDGFHFGSLGVGPQKT
jgi:hypothetical protein